MAEEIKNPNAEEEYQPDLMTLEDEDGNEVTFEVIDALDHKGVHYMAVVEYAEDEGRQRGCTAGHPERRRGQRGRISGRRGRRRDPAGSKQAVRKAAQRPVRDRVNFPDD